MGGGSYVEIPEVNCEETNLNGKILNLCSIYLPKNTIFETENFESTINNGSLSNFKLNGQIYNTSYTIIGEGSEFNYKIYKLTADDYILAEQIINIKIPVSEE